MSTLTDHDADPRTIAMIQRCAKAQGGRDARDCVLHGLITRRVLELAATEPIYPYLPRDVEGPASGAE